MIVAERRRRRVRQHVAEDQIERGGFQLIANAVSVASIIHHAELHHLYAVSPHLAYEDRELAMHLFQKPLKLRPVGMMANAEDADLAVSGFRRLMRSRMPGA